MSFVMVAIGGVTAFQQYQSGQLAKGQGALQKSALDYSAQTEREAALQTAAIIVRAGRRQQGQARGGYAAAGVKVDEGSAREVQDMISHDSQADAFQALLDGGRRARGMETQGSMALIDGQQRASAANINATTTLLGSFASGMKASGWRTAGPGFSGTQAPAPVETRTINYIPGR